jgi:YlmC/YmxH family sporulation protein
MELSYKELSKRDVINVPDGRCLGRIIDIRLSFPDGLLVGIVVPGRKSRGIFCFFDKTELYIDRSRIIKIGGDVILVDISCNPRPKPKPKPCPPPCTPTCHGKSNNDNGDFLGFSDVNSRIDINDYRD